MGDDTPPSPVQEPPAVQEAGAARHDRLPADLRPPELPLITQTAPDPRRFQRAKQDPLWVRVTLPTAALLVIGVLIVVPVVSVFVQAFADGVPAYLNELFGDRATRAAVLLTLTVAPTAVALNVVFGVAA